MCVLTQSTTKISTAVPTFEKQSTLGEFSCKIWNPREFDLKILKDTIIGNMCFMLCFEKYWFTSSNRINNGYCIKFSFSFLSFAFLFAILASKLNRFHASVRFHTEISHLICTINQITGFYMKWSIGLTWVKGNKEISIKKMTCQLRKSNSSVIK